MSYAKFCHFYRRGKFQLRGRRGGAPVGFFASRRIEAETEEAASSAVLMRLLSEPEIDGKALTDYTVFVKMVHEMPLDHKKEYYGFTFFPME